MTIHVPVGMAFVMCGDCGAFLGALPEDRSYRAWWVWHPHECAREAGHADR